jgi:uncharacterized protein involved in oxidation of intracellular sulfur
MKILTILNDAPYGSERSYNGLRLALSLAKRSDVEQRIFLMADAVSCARAGQRTPDGYYNLERMLRRLASGASTIGLCGSCMDARGLGEPDLVEGCRRSSMDELAEWVIWADKVVSW